jgi:peroxiredoxin family protein
MAGKPLFIVLCSGEHEKVQLAAMTASVGAVSDRTVHIFVSMDALSVFVKGQTPEQRYHGGALSKEFLEKKVPDAIELFRQGKELGEMTVHACSMMLDIKGWELDDLEDDLFDGPMGLTKFLADAEEGQIMTL